MRRGQIKIGDNYLNTNAEINSFSSILPSFKPH
jgi:hypothetical protein